MKMRILFATYSMAFQNPGGGERVLFALRSALQGLGHEVTIFSPWQGVNDNYDVIHYFSMIEFAYWGALRGFFPHKPLCVTPVHYLPNQGKTPASRFKLRIADWFDRQTGDGNELLSAMRLPDCFLPATETEAQGLIDYFRIPAEKIHIVPNGVSSHFFQAEPSLFTSRTGIAGPFVLHVGRFHPVKNQLKIIEAIRTIKCQAVFIGEPDTDQMDYYQACVSAIHEAEVSDQTKRIKISIFPAVKNDDPFLASAYAAASVLLMPSLFETFCISGLEAAIAGTPLILTKNLMSRKIFEPFSQLIDPENLSEITEAISSGLHAPRHADELRQDLCAQFTWKAIAKQLEDIYCKQISLKNKTHT